MATTTNAERLPKTLAQKYCLLAGVALTVAGILGFLAEGSFATGDELQGGSFLGFEVNGWHNLVHLASGLLLLGAANTRPTAKTVAMGFGFVYALVTVIGLVQGDEVLGIIPVNGADHVLHFLLAAAGIAAGLTSATTKRSQRRRAERHDHGTGTVGTSTGGTVGVVADEDRTRAR